MKIISSHAQSVKSALLVSMSCLALSACTFERESNSIPAAKQTYAHMNSLNTSVATVRPFVTSLTGQQDAISLFPNSPEQSMKNYLDARFHSSPYGMGSLEIHVSKFDIQRSRVSGGKKGVMSNVMKFNDHYEYKLSSTITLQHLDRDGRSLGATTVDLNKAIIMPSHLSIAKKEGHMQNFLEGYIEDVDKVLTERTQNRLGLASAY